MAAPNRIGFDPEQRDRESLQEQYRQYLEDLKADSRARRVETASAESQPGESTADPNRPRYDTFQPTGDSVDTGIYTVQRGIDGASFLSLTGSAPALEEADGTEPEEAAPAMAAPAAQKPQNDGSGGDSGMQITKSESHCFCDGGEHVSGNQACYIEIVSVTDAEGNEIDSPEVGRRISMDSVATGRPAPVEGEDAEDPLITAMPEEDTDA